MELGHWPRRGGRAVATRGRGAGRRVRLEVVPSRAPPRTPRLGGGGWGQGAMAPGPRAAGRARCASRPSRRATPEPRRRSLAWGGGAPSGSPELASRGEDLPAPGASGPAGGGGGGGWRSGSPGRGGRGGGLPGPGGWGPGGRAAASEEERPWEANWGRRVITGEGPGGEPVTLCRRPMRERAERLFFFRVCFLLN